MVANKTKINVDLVGEMIWGFLFPTSTGVEFEVLANMVPLSDASLFR